MTFSEWLRSRGFHDGIDSIKELANELRLYTQQRETPTQQAVCRGCAHAGFRGELNKEKST